ncbi:MAG: Glutaredoxin [Candidatus Woesebacteria bacterium GW2011_GWB1_39_10b]|uniref:Glutaredoxin n=2 Tax=Candidatus Woeseibacteriota TaxID=1752722 RepID=A0A0G0LZZ1_9BACT|nr:MAG: Glutaredoxin [Candidatus Woesebacteria bacterium GW2011_GWB1_39_10b]
MQVTVYSTTTCPYCKMLKDYLDEHKTVFIEKLVDQDDSAREEMMKASGGFLGVPFTVIVKDDGSKDTIIGFDKNRVNEILGISG